MWPVYRLGRPLSSPPAASMPCSSVCSGPASSGRMWSRTRRLPTAPIRTLPPQVLAVLSAAFSVLRCRFSLAHLGMRVVGTYPAQAMVSGYLPLDQILNLPTVPGFAAATPSFKPNPQVGSVTSQGDGVMYTDLLRSTLGLSGAGEKVGVLSD